MKNFFEVHGDITHIHVTRKGETFICLVDTKLLYHINKTPGNWWVDASGYAFSNTDGYMHRYIFNNSVDKVVDHINGNRLDNRRSNLRIVSQMVNANNRSKLNENNTSGISGVIWNKQRRKWVVQFRYHRKKYYGGYHETIEQAEAAIKELRRKVGEN